MVPLNSGADAMVSVALYLPDFFTKGLPCSASALPLASKVVMMLDTVCDNAGFKRRAAKSGMTASVRVGFVECSVQKANPDVLQPGAVR